MLLRSSIALRWRVDSGSSLSASAKRVADMGSASEDIFDDLVFILFLLGLDGSCELKRNIGVQLGDASSRDACRHGGLCVDFSRLQ